MRVFTRAGRREELRTKSSDCNSSCNKSTSFLRFAWEARSVQSGDQVRHATPDFRPTPETIHVSAGQSAPPFDPTASQSGSRVYYLLWRPRSSQPWHSEEHQSRIEAHNKYFSLMQRGYEAYLERRATPA